MTAIPREAEWSPAGMPMDFVSALSTGLMVAAREAGASREAFACAVAQMAESIVGFEPNQDLDGEVLRFVRDRLSAVVEAIDGSAS